MRRLLSAMLGSAMAFDLLPAAGAAASESRNVHQIASVEDLITIAEGWGTVFPTDGAYQLTADLDMSGLSWTPLSGFRGAFNGNGHSIQNLSINTEGSTGGIGFFSELLSGSVQNLWLENITYCSSANGPMGGIAGTALHGAKISNCKVTGTLEGMFTKPNSIGGLIGFVSAESGPDTVKIEDCMTNLYIKSKSEVALAAGGIAGTAASSLQIASCYSACSIELARGAYGKLRNCAGGILGCAVNPEHTSVELTGNVSNCPLLTAGITAEYRVGGILVEDSGMGSVVCSGNYYAPYYATDSIYFDADARKGLAFRRPEAEGITAATGKQLRSQVFFAGETGLDFKNTWVWRNNAPDLAIFPYRSGNGFSIWAASPLTSFSSNDRKYKMPSNASADYTLRGLKNETVSCQIAVKAGEHVPVTITALSVSDFVGCSGNIAAENVDLYREHYLYTGHHSKDGTESNPVLEAAWFPDALIPFLDPNTKSAPVDLEGTDGVRYPALPVTAGPSELLPFWVDVNIPKDVVAGDYIATYTVTTSDGGQKSGSLTLTVWNNTIPTQPMANSLITIKPSSDTGDAGNYYTPANTPGYGTEYFNDCNAMRAFLKDRFNVGGTLIYGNDFAHSLDLSQYAALLKDGQHIFEAGFWAECWWGVVDMLSVSQITQLYSFSDAPGLTGEEVIARRARELREAFGSGVRLVSYLVDEIEDAYDGSMPESYADTYLSETYDGKFNETVVGAHDAMREKLYTWHAALSKNGIDLLAVTKPYSDMIDTSDIAQARWEADGGTGPYNPEQYYDGPIVDIFVVKDSMFVPYAPGGHNLDVGKTVQSIQQWAADRGTPIEIWTYTALTTRDTPNWQLDFSPLNYRIGAGFINQSLSGTGYLNWAGNAWMFDPWSMVGIYNHAAVSDGTLVYPGDQVGIQGIVPSTRLKNYRDGMYDYDYIELLKQSGKGKEAMEIVRSIATGFTDWEKDPAKVEAARTALGELLAQSAATTGPTKPPSSAGSLSVPVIESSPFSDTSGSDGLL